jgi:S-adenosylmethionine/arginine decarboxylase-like enzyme
MAVQERSLQKDKNKMNFTGLCNYYQRFKSVFVDTIKLLTQLTEVMLTFHWYPEAVATSLVPEVVMCGTHSRIPMEFQSVLSQLMEDQEHVQAYSNRPLSKAWVF